MRVYIYATEGTYQGLHGVYNCQVVDVGDIEEANEYGYEMAFNVAESYGLTDEDEEIEQEFNWIIYSIKDSVEKTTDELDEICARMGFETFVDEYCDERLD